MTYPLPDALVGYTPGYGAVYDAQVNSSGGRQVDYRLVVMAAIRNGVAVVVWLLWAQRPVVPVITVPGPPKFHRPGHCHRRRR